MAKSAKQSKKRRLFAGTLGHPTPGERVVIDGAGNISIDFSGDPARNYVATIFEFASGGGGVGAVVGGPTSLIEDPGMPGHYTLDLSVGTVGANPPPNTNNRVIEIVDEISGDIAGYAFAAVQPPSLIHSSPAPPRSHTTRSTQARRLL